MKVMMKLLWMAVVLPLLVACGGTSKNEGGAVGVNEYDTSLADADGIQRMTAYHFTDTIRVDGRSYVYTIDRVSSDSLPVITDEEGNRYADNSYTLTIQSGGQTVFQRQFTKKTFMSYLTGEFQQRGILDGMMYDSTLPGFRFAVSVSLPQSDMMEPLLMQVDTNGGIVITRDERGEAELEDDEDGV